MTNSPAELPPSTHETISVGPIVLGVSPVPRLVILTATPPLTFHCSKSVALPLGLPRFATPENGTRVSAPPGRRVNVEELANRSPVAIFSEPEVTLSLR